MIQLVLNVTNDLSERSNASFKNSSYTEYKHSRGIKFAKLGVPNNFGPPCIYCTV